MRRKHSFSYFAQIHSYAWNLVIMFSVIFSLLHMEWQASLRIFILPKKHRMFFVEHFNILNYFIFSRGSFACFFLYWIVSFNTSSRVRQDRSIWGNWMNRGMSVGARGSSQDTSGGWVRWGPAEPLAGGGKKGAKWNLRCTELEGTHVNCFVSMMPACAPGSSDEVGDHKLIA